MEEGGGVNEKVVLEVEVNVALRCTYLSRRAS